MACRITGEGRGSLDECDFTTNVLLQTENCSIQYNIHVPLCAINSFTVTLRNVYNVYNN